MDLCPFPVPGYRFDQRNEMFKHRTLDEEFVPHGKRLYTQSKSSIRPSLALTQKRIVPKLNPSKIFLIIDQRVEIRAVMS
jgi:hypothetical protein